MQNNLIRRLLIDEEGCKLEPHKVKGIWHIGIGHNLEIDQTDEELEILGEFDDPSQVKLTDEEARALFSIDVDDALDDVAVIFGQDELEELGETRRAIILSMVFQMGGAGVRKFKNFVSAVKMGEFATAADEMLYANVEVKRHSAWYKQTPERCQRAADAMRVGYFAQYEPIDAQDLAVLGDSPLSAFTDKELLEELLRRCHG